MTTFGLPKDDGGGGTPPGNPPPGNPPPVGTTGGQPPGPYHQGNQPPLPGGGQGIGMPGGQPPAQHQQYPPHPAPPAQYYPAGNYFPPGTAPGFGFGASAAAAAAAAAATAPVPPYPAQALASATLVPPVTPKHQGIGMGNGDNMARTPGPHHGMQHQQQPPTPVAQPAVLHGGTYAPPALYLANGTIFDPSQFALCWRRFPYGQTPLYWDPNASIYFGTVFSFFTGPYAQSYHQAPAQGLYNASQGLQGDSQRSQDGSQDMKPAAAPPASVRVQAQEQEATSQISQVSQSLETAVTTSTRYTEGGTTKKLTSVTAFLKEDGKLREYRKHKEKLPDLLALVDRTFEDTKDGNTRFNHKIGKDWSDLVQEAEDTKVEIIETRALSDERIANWQKEFDSEIEELEKGRHARDTKAIDDKMADLKSQMVDLERKKRLLIGNQDKEKKERRNALQKKINQEIRDVQAKIPQALAFVADFTVGKEVVAVLQKHANGKWDGKVKINHLEAPSALLVLFEKAVPQEQRDNYAMVDYYKWLRLPAPASLRAMLTRIQALGLLKFVRDAGATNSPRYQDDVRLLVDAEILVNGWTPRCNHEFNDAVVTQNALASVGIHIVDGSQTCGGLGYNKGSNAKPYESEDMDSTCQERILNLVRKEPEKYQMPDLEGLSFRPRKPAPTPASKSNKNAQKPAPTPVAASKNGTQATPMGPASKSNEQQSYSTPVTRNGVGGDAVKDQRSSAGGGLVAAEPTSNGKAATVAGTVVSPGSDQAPTDNLAGGGPLRRSPGASSTLKATPVTRNAPLGPYLEDSPPATSTLKKTSDGITAGEGGTPTMLVKLQTSDNVEVVRSLFHGHLFRYLAKEIKTEINSTDITDDAGFFLDENIGEVVARGGCLWKGLVMYIRSKREYRAVASKEILEGPVDAAAASLDFSDEIVQQILLPYFKTLLPQHSKADAKLCFEHWVLSDMLSEFQSEFQAVPAVAAEPYRFTKKGDDYTNPTSVDPEEQAAYLASKDETKKEPEPKPFVTLFMNYSCGQIYPKLLSWHKWQDSVDDFDWSQRQEIVETLWGVFLDDFTGKNPLPTSAMEGTSN